MRNIKNIIIVVLAVVVIVLAGLVKNVHMENNMIKYAAANNCTWTWQGTMYGDDRDYICK